MKKHKPGVILDPYTKEPVQSPRRNGHHKSFGKMQAFVNSGN